MKCKLNTDMWEDLGVEHFVIAYNRRPNSTAVTLELESEDGEISTRVVAWDQIEWIEDES